MLTVALIRRDCNVTDITASYMPVAGTAQCRGRVPDLPAFSYEYIWWLGTAVAQWVRCCATNRKIAGSIPAGVTGIFH